MQLMFVLSFFLTVIVMVGMGSSDGDRRSADRSKAVAVQMSGWHRAAFEFCEAGNCSGGSAVPVLANLPATLREGDFYATGTFVTRYDPATRLVVTWASEARLAGTEATSGTVVAAMRDALREDTTSFGSFDRATGTVSPSYVPGGRFSAVRTVPASIASAIPDGSPVIASRL